MEVFVKEGKNSYWLDVDEFLKRINGEKKRRVQRDREQLLKDEMGNLPSSIRYKSNQ